MFVWQRVEYKTDYCDGVDDSVVLEREIEAGKDFFGPVRVGGNVFIPHWSSSDV